MKCGRAESHSPAAILVKAWRNLKKNRMELNRLKTQSPRFGRTRVWFGRASLTVPALLMVVRTFFLTVPVILLCTSPMNSSLMTAVVMRVVIAMGCMAWRAMCHVVAVRRCIVLPIIIFFLLVSLVYTWLRWTS